MQKIELKAEALAIELESLKSDLKRGIVDEWLLEITLRDAEALCALILRQTTDTFIIERQKEKRRIS